MEQKWLKSKARKDLNMPTKYAKCICVTAVQLTQGSFGQEEEERPFPVDPEMRAHLEAKVISSMSLKDIEAMVENSERVRNAPPSKLIIIPKPKKDGEDNREAIIIQRKPKKEVPPFAGQRADRLEYKLDDVDFDKFGVGRFSFEQPSFRFENEFRRSGVDRGFPSLLRMSDLQSEASSPAAEKFYESIVSRVMGGDRFQRDPFDILEIAASEDVPRYKPRFDYDAYSKDSTQTKLQGKPYWKDAPERRDEMIDENGCRTVVKKIVDPEDGKKKNSNGDKVAKSVVITKECEYPDLNGPDAKIPEAGQRPPRRDTSRFDMPSTYDIQPEAFEEEEEESRREQLDASSNNKRKSGPEGRDDPLASDYIDSMLDKHFSSFPGFSANPLSSFRGYQERFKLRAPEEAFASIKPTIKVQNYEFSHPKSGFEDDEVRQSSSSSSKQDLPPRTYEQHRYESPERKPEYDDVEKSDAKSKEPKMLKKSFAYYRKDNPKDNPDDQQYAEEYAQGNFRSFSSSYDSERDGPKKKE